MTLSPPEKTHWILPPDSAFPLHHPCKRTRLTCIATIADSSVQPPISLKVLATAMVRIPNPFGLSPGARRLTYSEACFADVIPLSRTDPTDIPIPLNRYLNRFGYEASVRFQGRWSPSLRLSSHFQLLFDTGGTFAPEVALECTNYRKRQHNTYRQFYSSFDFIKLAQAFLTGQGHLVSQMAGMFSLTEEWLFGDRDMALAWFNQLDYESRNGYENKQMIHDYPINY